MVKYSDFTVQNELTYGRGYVYSLQYHLVWCTKYRKKVLRDGIDTECREMLEEMAGEYKFTITAMEVNELWGGHLWNPSYCAVTASDRSREQVERYILTQKDRA